MDNDRPLRIAMLLPTFPELSNTFILTQVTGLLDLGHEVDLFAIERKPFGIPTEWERYDLASRMRHRRVSRNRWKRTASAAHILFRSKHRFSAALIDALDPRRHGRAAWSLARLHTVASFLDSGDYDILHAQFGNHGPAAQRLVTLGVTSARLVTSFRGADITKHIARRPANYRELLRNGSGFLPVSRDFRDRLIAVGAPADRVHIQRSGIDLRRFAYSPRRRPEGRAQLIFVGRLTEKKGLVHALDALAILRREGDMADLTVVGDGPLATPLRAHAAALGLTDRVRFVGELPHEDVIAHLHGSHVLLAPSVTAENGDQEGIPNVLKEAMATGLPVVTTWHSGIPELVEHGVSGFLAPERNPDVLASHLRNLLEHPERWAELGRAGRLAVEAGFDAKRLNELLVDRYRLALAHRPMAGAQGRARR